MKPSIYTIFKNITRTHYLILVLLLMSALFIHEQYNYYKKVEILHEHRKVVSNLYKLEDIEFENQRANLKTMIVKLNILEEFNFLNQNLSTYFQKYETQIDRLNLLEDKLSENIYTFINLKDKKTFNENQKNIYIRNIEKRNLEIFNHIAKILEDLSKNNLFIFNIFIKLLIFTVVVFIFITFWYQKQLNIVYKDILFLLHLDNRSKAEDSFSTEIETIVNKQKRRAVITDAHTSLLDPVTHLNNNEGFLMEYTNKNLSKYKVLTLSILEVDNSEKFRDEFSRAFTQAVLKKIAQTISLHVEPRDIVSRSSYNQFTIILSKQTIEEANDTMEEIRKSVSNLNLKTKITVTGGTTTLETYLPLIETITKVKDLLNKAKKAGSNQILKG